MNKRDMKLTLIEMVTAIPDDDITSIDIRVDNNLWPIETFSGGREYLNLGRRQFVATIDIDEKTGRKLFGKRKDDDGCPFLYNKEGPRCGVREDRHGGYFNHAYGAPGCRE